MNLQETPTWNRRLAKRLLIKYIRMAAQPQRFDHDQSVEIETIIDHIIAAAVKEAVKQVKKELLQQTEDDPDVLGFLELFEEQE